MIARIATGVILAPLLTWLLLSAPLVGVVAVVSLAVAQSVRELLGMFTEVGAHLRRLACLFAFTLCWSPLWPGSLSLAIIGAGASVLLGFCLRRPDDLARQARIGAFAVLALGYVGAMGAALSAIAALPGESPIARSAGQAALLGHFLVVFLGDTGAYFAGRLAGRHKLYPAVSPKKTVQGGIGGLVAGAIGLPIYCAYALPEIPWHFALAAAVGLGVVAQIGDFAESMFKRATDTKDSGTLLPGHGGMFDRLDGVLFAAPWTLLLLTLART